MKLGKSLHSKEETATNKYLLKKKKNTSERALLLSDVKVAQSCPTLCAPQTIQSMEFSRPEYWSE